MVQKIGVTEGYDPAFKFSWLRWVTDNKPAILITKNPKIIYEKIIELNVPYNIIVHCTITGNGATTIEPGAPPYKESLEYLYKFVELLGPKRTVLRIDPIMPISEYVQNSVNVWKEAKAHLQENMCRVRISFYDNYKHTEKRLKEQNIDLKHTSFHIPLDIRKRIWRDLGQPELCAEPDMPSTPCLSELDCKILNIQPGTNSGYQRQHCNCLSNKHELIPIKRQCSHRCSYCYFKNDHISSKTLF